MKKEQVLRDIVKEEESTFSKLSRMAEVSKILVFCSVKNKSDIIECLLQHVCREISDFGESELLLTFGFKRRHINVNLLELEVEKGRVLDDGAEIEVSVNFSFLQFVSLY